MDKPTGVKFPADMVRVTELTDQDALMLKLGNGGYGYILISDFRQSLVNAGVVMERIEESIPEGTAIALTQKQ